MARGFENSILVLGDHVLFSTLITRDPASVSGLTERVRYFDGRPVSEEPRVFAFGTALLESTPLPDHYKPILPAGLAGVSVGLGLKDRTLLDWMSDDLTADAKASLVALLQSLSKLPNWLVIYEAGAGSGRRTVECANGLFDCISSAITDASGYDVTVIVPGS